MHQRKVIRDAVVAALVGQTAAGARVTPSKVRDHRVIQLPAISVYTLSEPIDQDSMSRRPARLKRLLSVDVAIAVAHSEANPADDQMDAIAEQVEAVMDADPFLGGVCGYDGLVLANTDIEINDEADPPVGVARLTYTVPYDFDATAEPVLAEFLTAASTTIVDGATEENAAQDIIQVRE